MSGFPLHDPQFWLVTAATAAVVVWAVRRIRRSMSRPSDSACSSCPAAGSAANDRDRPPRGAGGALLLALALASAATAQAPVKRIVAAMGTELRVEVAGLERPEALALAEELIEAIEGTEERLSTWRDDSELARFNRQPIGVPLALSRPAWKALAEAVRCAHESEGAFDPTIGPLVVAWGLRQGGRLPTEAELEPARARVGLAGLALDRPSYSATRATDIQIEEGGFGKGAALEAALAVARERAPTAAVTLDFGGQLAWTGRATGMTLRIADPRDRARPVLELDLELREGSASTSSDSERVRELAGVRIGHLLDPRTGRPAAEFGSATTIGPRPTLADCRSTGLYVLGPERGRARVAAAPSQGDNLLLVVEEGKLRALAPARLRGRLRALVPELELEFVGRSLR